VADEPADVLLLAEIASARGDYAGALRICDDAQRMAAEREVGTVYRLDFIRADALARTGRIDDARAAYQREIAAFPNDVHAYANLAILQYLSGMRGDADKTLRLLAAKNPALAARTRETLR
jgi:Flp pilus assembly protein TadD